MAAILRDSTVVVVVVVVVAVVRTRPRAIPLSMINLEKIHTWVSFSYMVMGLRLAALRAAGAPLLCPSDHVTFFLSYKILAIYNDVLDDFLKIFNHFPKLEGGKGRGGRITFR